MIRRWPRRAQDEANLANARVDLARYERLLVGDYASKQQHATQKASVAQLEALVRADKAAIDNAKTTLDYATIRSPIDGRVGIRLVDVGNILHASDQTGIVVITQLKPIYVVFTLPQQALPAVQKAQARKAKVSALGPDNATPIEIGELTVIDNQIDQQTGTVRMKATFANPNARALARPIRQCAADARHDEECPRGAEPGGAAWAERRLRLRAGPTTSRRCAL